MHLLSQLLQRLELTTSVVVADLGFAKRARNFADILEAPLALHREAPPWATTDWPSR